MIGRIAKAIHHTERALQRSFGNAIDTPWQRFASKVHFQLMDHAFLRHLWTNFDQVSDGVYRSNQPDLRRLRKAKRMGITTILNLRGASEKAHYLFEAENCAQLGLTLVSVPFSARSAPGKAELSTLFEHFKTLERPFLLHCKSGADRAGFVSVLYLLVHDGVALAEARKHLSLRYLHLKSTKTGILDHVLDLYAPHETQMSFADWVKDHYDPDAATASFAALRARK